MPRGGKRPGAGRKPGINRTEEARAVVAKHAREMATDVPPHIARTSPLDVMLRAMTLRAAADDWAGAALHAAAAARYCHPTLSAIEHSGAIGTDPDALSDADLAAIAAGSGAAAAGEADGKA